MKGVSPQDCKRLGTAALNRQHHAEAVQWFQRLFYETDSQIDRGAVALDAAYCLEQLGQCDDAARWALRALEADPLDSEALSLYLRMVNIHGGRRAVRWAADRLAALGLAMCTGQIEDAELERLLLPPRTLAVSLDDGRDLQVGTLKHMVLVDNLPSILQMGLLSYNEVGSRGLSPTSLALSTVQSLRDRVWLQLPGSRDMANLHDFVPFYFVHHTPMLYRRAELQDRIVFIEATPRLLHRPGVVFSDGNASVQGLSQDPCVSVRVTVSTSGEPCKRVFYKAGHPRPTWSVRHSSSEIFGACCCLGRVDWELLAAPYWSGHPDGRRIRCAEVLVQREVSVAEFCGFTVGNKALLSEVEGMVRASGFSLPVCCSPECFFPDKKPATYALHAPSAEEEIHWQSADSLPAYGAELELDDIPF